MFSECGSDGVICLFNSIHNRAFLVNESQRSIDLINPIHSNNFAIVGADNGILPEDLPISVGIQ